MASPNSLPAVSALLALAIAGLFLCAVHAGDPELTTDFFVPVGTNISTIDGSFFTFTGFRGGAPPAAGKSFGVNKAFSGAFPALTGLGVAYAFLDFLPGGLNPMHTHPRGTELLYVLQGSLSVGLIDTNNKLFTQELKQGDLFVFPKGLVHFQTNKDKKNEAKALSAFSSSNPGLVSLPATIFGSNVDHKVLEKAFSVTRDIIKHLQAPFAPQA